MDHIAESSPKAEEAKDWEGAIHGAHPSSCPTQVELDCGSSRMEGQVLQTQLSENWIEQKASDVHGISITYICVWNKYYLRICALNKYYLHICVCNKYYLHI